MADVLVKPATPSTHSDTGDATRIGPSAWNAARLFTGGSNGEIVVRDSTSATGAAWSASAALTNFTLPATTSAAIGILFKGAQPFLHNYADPTSDGLNTFLGLDAGNFTMARVGISAQASYNTGVGRAVLQGLTIGFSNDAFGESTLKATTSGVHNAAFGTGGLVFNTTGSFNSALGSNALWGNVGGDNNTGVGMGAGYTETPANANVSGSQNTFVGTEAGPGSAAQLTNAIHIGYRAHGTASNEVVLGNASILATTLRGSVTTDGNIQTTGASASFVAPAAGFIYFLNRAVFTSPADGHLAISNNGISIGSRIKADALPTIASGFGGSPSITAGSTPFAGSVNVGSGGAASSGVIDFNGVAFPSAPFVVASPVTAGNTYPILASASATQLTLSAGAAWPANTVISWISVSAK